MNIFKEIDRYFYPSELQKHIDYFRNLPLADRDLNELKDDPEFQAEFYKHLYPIQEMVDKEDAKHG